MILLAGIIAESDGVGCDFISEPPDWRFVHQPHFEVPVAPFDVQRFIWSLERSGPCYVWWKDHFWTRQGVIIHPVEMYGAFDGDGDVDLRDIAQLQIRASEGLKDGW